jgi:hypothetical protein
MNCYTRMYRSGATAAILAVLLAGCHPSPNPPAPAAAAPISVTPVAPAGPPGSWNAVTNLVNLSPGPIVQFEAGCARCHGPQGSLFDAGFSGMDLHGLRREVVEMMTGPAQLHPSLGQIHAMTAYVQAMHAGTPFVVVNNAAAFANGQQRVLRGEVTPGTTVELRQDGQPIRAVVKGLAWTATNPPPLPFSIVAVKGDKQVSFPFPLHQWNGPPEDDRPAGTQNIPVPSGLP